MFNRVFAILSSTSLAKGVALVTACSIMLGTLSACGSPKNTIITKSNEDKVLSDIGPKLSDKERTDLAAAIARSAFGSYAIEGKTVNQILSEQKKFEDDEKAAEQAAHEAQVKEEQRRAAIEAKINAAISIYPVSKEYQSSNYDIESGDMHGDQIVMVFQIHNKTRKAIKEFEGTTHFANSFGDEIESNNLDYAHAIPAGATVKYTGVLDYNEFTANDRKLRTTPLSDMKFKFDPKGITFVDGSQIIAPSAESDD